MTKNKCYTNNPSWIVLYCTYNAKFEEYDVLWGKNEEIRKLIKKSYSKADFSAKLKSKMESQYCGRTEYEFLIKISDEKSGKVEVAPWAFGVKKWEKPDTRFEEKLYNVAQKAHISKIFSVEDNNSEKIIKTDVFDQLQCEWDAFVDYCLKWAASYKRKVCYSSNPLNRKCDFHVKGNYCTNPKYLFDLVKNCTFVDDEIKKIFKDDKISEKMKKADEEIRKEAERETSIQTISEKVEMEKTLEEQIKDLKLKYEENQKSFENKIKELEEAIKREKNDKNNFKLKIGEKYYTLTSFGIEEGTWLGARIDNDLILRDNVFKSKEEAEWADQHRIVTAELKRFVQKNDPNPITEEDWECSNDTRAKYYIRFVYESRDEIKINYTLFGTEANRIYASNEKVLEEAIQYIGKERLKKYYFGIK